MNEPKTLRDVETGSTFMLASEIQERTSVSQIYEKVDDTTVRLYGSDEERTLPEDELVYPFEPAHAAPDV